MVTAPPYIKIWTSARNSANSRRYILATPINDINNKNEAYITLRTVTTPNAPIKQVDARM